MSNDCEQNGGCSKEDGPIASLVDAYRRMDPSKEFLDFLKQKLSDSWSSLDTQGEIVRKVFHDPHILEFPPLPNYTFRVLKQYVTTIEAQNKELSDDLVALLLEYMRTTTDTSIDELYYLTYRVDEYILTCRVSQTNNLVGLRLWEAAYYLSEFVLLNRSIFNGRNVLEIGAGVGLTGMILSHSMTDGSIHLTDGVDQVVQNLRYNVEINHLKNIPIKVETLDWNAWTNQEAEQMQPDLLICADCVYDIESFPAMISMLNVFFAYQCSTDVERIALFAVAKRNEETLQRFIRELKSRSINCNALLNDRNYVLPQENSPFLHYKNRNDVMMWKLTK